MEELKKKLPLRLDIQFFAEEEESKGDEEETKDEESVTLTQKELQAKIDSEKDKHAQKVWETKSKKLREELLAEIEEQKKKEKELSKLSEEERQKKELEQKLAEIEEREAKIKTTEQLAQTKSILAEKELDTSFADMVVVVGDNEKTLENINKLKEYVDNKVNEAIKSNARQSSPLLGGSAPSGSKKLGVFGGSSERAKRAQEKYFGKE